MLGICPSSGRKSRLFGKPTVEESKTMSRLFNSSTIIIIAIIIIIICNRDYICKEHIHFISINTLRAKCDRVEQNKTE